MARASTVFALLCSVFASLPVLAIDRPVPPDVVFCPLQKQWVKKSPPRIREAVESLNDICAEDRDKTAFVDRLFLKLAGRSLADESVGSLFIDFSSKGDRVFAGFASRPNLPDRPASSLLKQAFSSLTVRLELAVRVNEQLPFHQPALLHQRDKASGSFARDFHDLETISRSIRPRAPPISL